jgi:hypothetical protein
MIRTILIVATLSFSAFPAAPSTPALLSPLCKQTGVAPTPRFSWRKAIGASSYQLQISSDFGYKTLVKDTGGLRDTTYNQTQFLYFSTYYKSSRRRRDEPVVQFPDIQDGNGSLHF